MITNSFSPPLSLLITKLLTRSRLLKSFVFTICMFCFRVPLASFSLFDRIELFQAAIDRSLFIIREFHQLEISSVRFSFDDQFRSRSRSLARPRLNYSMFMGIGFQWTFQRMNILVGGFYGFLISCHIVSRLGIFEESIWYKLTI